MTEQERDCGLPKASVLGREWKDQSINSPELSGAVEVIDRPICLNISPERCGNVLLESFSDELSAQILSFMSLQEIASYAIVSKALYSCCKSGALWKRLFENRWNVKEEQKDYFTSYKQAHLHPHDLWITHWNCTYPAITGRSTGRCRISHNTESRISSRGFETAATFHRNLSLSQYTSGSSTNFLTDLLFFNLTDTTTYEGQWELCQLLREAQDRLEFEDRFATAHHSWHICRLRNPDYFRPLVFQIGLQRPDCFTVFPSEGYIEPGESVFVTFGVRTLGSALAYAFEGLNVLRDGISIGWSDLYAEEAHLPLVPVIIRYHFVPVPPVKMDSDLDADVDWPLASREEDTHANSTLMKDTLQFFRTQNTPAHQTNAIRLSGHVNAHYFFGHFLRATRHQWTVFDRPSSGPKYVSPVLREQHPRLYRYIESATGGFSSHRYDYSGENRMIENIVLLLRMAVEGNLTGQKGKVAMLIYVATRRLQHSKASPWKTQKQLAELVFLEAILDAVYAQIKVGGERWTPWRMSGCYRSPICTHSVFFLDHRLQSDVEDLDLSIDMEWSDEPDFLDFFRHLTHSPGAYCLGPQEDPNHLGETTVLNSSRYTRSQVGCVTDIFMDNPVYAFQAGICMIRDPRSLLVHGVYDWIPYPGTLVYRPRLEGPADEFCARLLESARIPSELTRLWLQETVDMRSVFREIQEGSLSTTTLSPPVPYSLFCYLRGVPLPGQGRFVLSTENDRGDVVPLPLPAGTLDDSPTDERAPDQATGPVFDELQLPPLPDPNNNRPPRFLQLLWILGAQMGLAVTEGSNGTAVFVERNILIASQWVSVSFMAAPLFYTLVGRCCRWIPTEPLLQDPLTVTADMRFLTDEECGFVAALVFVFWLALARWTERHTYRDFFRVMMERVSPAKAPTSFWSRFLSRLLTRYQRLWDAICPLFIQRRVFTPHWNRRSPSDLHRIIAGVRSRDLFDRQEVTHASTIRLKETALFGDGRDTSLQTVDGEGSTRKLLIGLAVSLGSFCSSTPHFWLNLVTIFSCSISLGMSVSLHSLEKGRLSHSNNTGSMLKQFSVVTVVILAILVGQLVGSSGGTMFLAEFVVTSVSLLLGGAGTISASAMESWGCFLCLSSSAFWGYLFGRVALLDGVRQRRNCHSTILLSRAVAFLVLFWVFLFFLARWDTPVNVLIVRPPPHGSDHPGQEYISRKLQ